jgi:hypothetical protein
MIIAMMSRQKPASNDQTSTGRRSTESCGTYSDGGEGILFANEDQKHLPFVIGHFSFVIWA